MNNALLLLIAVVTGTIGFTMWRSSQASGTRTAASLSDAKADARRVNAFERPPQESPTDPWITARL